VEITHNAAVNIEPVWSPEGNRIYFLSDQDGYRCVWARNVDPHTAQPLGEAFEVIHFHRTARRVQGPMAYSGTIGLAAARDFLVLTLTDVKGEIWSWTTR
jgi:hypothetical protein